MELEFEHTFRKWGEWTPSSHPAAPLLDHPNFQIVDVWQHNFEQEMARLMHFAHLYPIVAFDTEFPGIAIQNKYTDDLVASFFSNLRMTLIWLEITSTSWNSYKLDSASATVRATVLAWYGSLISPLTWSTFHCCNARYEPYHPDSINILKDSGIDFN